MTQIPSHSERSWEEDISQLSCPVVTRSFSALSRFSFKTNVRHTGLQQPRRICNCIFVYDQLTGITWNSSGDNIRKRVLMVSFPYVSTSMWLHPGWDCTFRSLVNLNPCTTILNVPFYIGTLKGPQQTYHIQTLHSSWDKLRRPHNRYVI